MIDSIWGRLRSVFTTVEPATLAPPVAPEPVTVKVEPAPEPSTPSSIGPRGGRLVPVYDENWTCVLAYTEVPLNVERRPAFPTSISMHMATGEASPKTKRARATEGYHSASYTPANSRVKVEPVEEPVSFSRYDTWRHDDRDRFEHDRVDSDSDSENKDEEDDEGFTWDYLPNGYIVKEMSHAEYEETAKLDVGWATRSVVHNRGSKDARRREQGSCIRRMCLGTVVCAGCAAEMRPRATGGFWGCHPGRIWACSVCGGSVKRVECSAKEMVWMWRDGVRYEHHGVHRHAAPPPKMKYFRMSGVEEEDMRRKGHAHETPEEVYEKHVERKKYLHVLPYQYARRRPTSRFAPY